MTITWNNYFMRTFVMIQHSFHIDSFSITKRFTWSILTASFTNTCSLYCRALVYQKRFFYSAKGLNIRTCFFCLRAKVLNFPPKRFNCPTMGPNIPLNRPNYLTLVLNIPPKRLNYPTMGLNILPERLNYPPKRLS